MTQTFKERVYSIVADIPAGETLTYQEVAEKAGSPGAYRAVGSFLKANTDRNIPCHRVIRSDGSVGEYNGLRGDKESLLEKEKHANKA